MNKAGVLGVLSVCLQLVSCSPAVEKMDPHQLALKQHYHHLSYIADFKCHVPQPRVVPVSHLLSQVQLKGKAFFPDVTVLHRCDISSGCCDSGLHCGPLDLEPVHLPFKATYLDDIEHHKKGSWIIESHTFVNHTLCGCQELKYNVPPVVDYKQLVPSTLPHVNYEMHVRLSPVPEYYNENEILLQHHKEHEHHEHKEHEHKEHEHKEHEHHEHEVHEHQEHEHHEHEVHEHHDHDHKPSGSKDHLGEKVPPGHKTVEEHDKTALYDDVKWRSPL